MVVVIASSVFAEEVTNEQLLELIKKQQVQIERLMKMVKDNKNQVEETDLKIESTVSAIESGITVESTSRTTVGGYGELHYNNIEDSSGDKESIDFHRFVMFFGHEFTDDIRMFSELEVEHALSGDGKPGEVELEQAYIEMDINDQSLMRAGVFLIPVGIMNETHEPPTFFGVERNPVEKNIIPATWWEAGIGYAAKLKDGWSVDVAIHSGLNVPTEGSKSFLIRNGRQKVAKAKADNLAYTGRIKYTAIPGLEVAASYQIQDDITQGVLDASASLFTAHAVYNSGKLGLKALYAIWNIDSNEADVTGRDQQSGYYIEPSYRMNDQWGFFIRYDAWNNNAGLSSSDTEKTQSNFGVNYWPHENVVFKFDIENRSGAQDGKGFNLGVGYMF